MNDKRIFVEVILCGDKEFDKDNLVDVIIESIGQPGLKEIWVKNYITELPSSDALLVTGEQDG